MEHSHTIHRRGEKKASPTKRNASPISPRTNYIIDPMPKQPVHKDDNQTGVITRTEAKTKKPSLYKVLLLNDDYTPMEFVVHRA